MDVLIKSFNRPYYLERCLLSLRKYLIGDYKVLILDDGTPGKYLDKIQNEFPESRIIYSPNYKEKAKQIEYHLDNKIVYNNFIIPSEFWYESIKEVSDKFILIEDDIWLTHYIDIREMSSKMVNENMVMLRLSWQGNDTLIAGNKINISENIEKIIPRIPYFSKFIFLNKFKSRSVLYRFGFYKNIMPIQLKFYVLYAVAAAVFDKKYWLFLWENAGDKINEENQLKKAIIWYAKNKSCYGKMINESAETSYISSTNNAYHEIEFDMILFNHIINENWLTGELDSMQNFPNDFSLDYIKTFLNEFDNNNLFQYKWLSWVDRFKKSYRDVGCRVG